MPLPPFQTCCLQTLILRTFENTYCQIDTGLFIHIGMIVDIYSQFGNSTFVRDCNSAFRASCSRTCCISDFEAGSRFWICDNRVGSLSEDIGDWQKGSRVERKRFSKILEIWEAVGIKIVNRFTKRPVFQISFLTISWEGQRVMSTNKPNNVVFSNLPLRPVPW